jgi:hypothetical protein
MNFCPQKFTPWSKGGVSSPSINEKHFNQKPLKKKRPFFIEEGPFAVFVI